MGEIATASHRRGSAFVQLLSVMDELARARAEQARRPGVGGSRLGDWVWFRFWFKLNGRQKMRVQIPLKSVLI